MRDGRNVERNLLNVMAAALAHRGPDGVGIHQDGAVGMLNTRLAIIDIAGGDQPFVTPGGQALVANGEIYNDPDLRFQLAGTAFRSLSDCEPPLHLYLRDGITFARHLRGMFAIAIHDKPADRLILSRDIYGIKQLYYVETPTCLAFASEPQALIRAGLANRTIRPQARAELLQLQFTTGRNTIFSDIKRVLPGETLVVENGRVTQIHRLRPNGAPTAQPDRRPAYRDADHALADLDRHLTDSVALHVRSDVPTGLFLSGGIDSSALLSVMARLSSRPIITLTAGFPGCGKDESEKAERVARGAGADHNRIDVTAADFFTVMPQLAMAMDDPTTDSSALPIFLLAAGARRQGLKVVLSGEGADELFGGYKRYRRATWFFGLWRQKTRTRGVFRSDAGAYGCLQAWRDGLEQAERAESRPYVSAIQTLQSIDCAEWLPNDLLLKLDRCLMAHGVEGRTPFLDPVLSPFAYNLPADLKVRGNLGKWLLRDWVAKHAPAADPWSKKKGFIPPVGQWIAAYKDRIEPHLLTHPAMTELSLQPMIRQVFADPVRNPQACWSLIFYALWYSCHIMGLPCDGAIDEVLNQSRLAA